MRWARQCETCLAWGQIKLGRDGQCASCQSWQAHSAGRRECRGCLRVLPVDGDDLCRGCVIAARAELSAGRAVGLPFANQLHLHIVGLGLGPVYSLPRSSRRDPAPALTPRVVTEARGDPGFLPAVVPGQLSLLPSPRRRLVRADRHRIAERRWPEEVMLVAQAEAMAAEAGLSPTWPRMVMSLLRLALAVRDADGDTLVNEEVLDQIALPLKAAGAQVLDHAGLLRPRRALAPPRHPVRGCEDCHSWGITTRRCRGCACWRDDRVRYPPGRCGRCRRDLLPLHAEEGLCRGCLLVVREFGPLAGRDTQLTFAGDLAFRLSTQAGVLGFTPHKESGPTLRERARRRATTATVRPPSPHLVDPGQHTLLTVDRDWSAIRALTADELPALTELAAALLAEFTANAPARSGGGAPGGTALLRTLLAWLGARAPFRERDVRALAASATSPSTRRVLDFLHQHGLLQPDEPDQRLRADQQRYPSTAVADLDTNRRNRHHQHVIAARIDTLPEPMAGHLHAWVRVLRGQGRRRHQPASYERIRRYLSLALPVLLCWAEAGLDMRQITATHIREELARRHGSQARDLHHVLRTLFAALKQERLVFHNPMARISLSTPVRVPAPLPSDRLRGLLDEVDGPRARLLVALVAVHGLRPLEVTRLRLDDLDLIRLVIRVPRRGHTHTVYLDELTVDLINAWLTERHRRWLDTTNPHLFITSQSAHHPARPPLSYCGLRAAFDQVGLVPKQLWRDRVLHEAQHTADPVHLIRLFGIHPSTAVKYVNAAHPDKALPKTR
ncbi:tyrosine-type recombinase/integrase [Amycolatopsis roodepoortensis]|uniref:tyrosine-type recombinase/integrase n=1 Tax=Amycolatopsis TaxID=1813 RepID=UPI000E25C9F8|nr:MULTISPECIES: tyrosine-type recombinase/integrase [Amycolatopsis]UUV32314.1 tyrosine-type recombinase/integrase [Amycolatopsis roodepoortensis]